MQAASEPLLLVSSKGMFVLSSKAELLSTYFYVLGSPDENIRFLRNSQAQSQLKRGVNTDPFPGQGPGSGHPS